MDGDLDELIDALAQEYQAEQLAALVAAEARRDADEGRVRCAGRRWLETLRLDAARVRARTISTISFASTRDPRVMRYIGERQAGVARRGRRGVAARSVGYHRALSRISAAGTRRAATPARSSAGSASSTAGTTCDVEVGYRLLPGGLGPGLRDRRRDARSSATASTTLALDRIIGVTHPGNIASQRVLMKAGLADAGWGHYYDTAAAPVRARGDPARAMAGARSAMTQSGAAATVRAALAQSGLVPLDAQVLLAHVLGSTRAWLIAHADDALPRDAARPRSWRSRSAAATASRSPISPARASSGDCRCAVSPAVLIPRPETETLVELRARPAAARTGRPRVLDLGTGSGAIALAIAHERPRGARLRDAMRRADALARRARATRSGWASRNVALLASPTGTRACPRWAVRRDRQQPAVRRRRRSAPRRRATCASSRRRRSRRAATGWLRCG